MVWLKTLSLKFSFEKMKAGRWWSGIICTWKASRLMVLQMLLVELLAAQLTWSLARDGWQQVPGPDLRGQLS